MNIKIDESNKPKTNLSEDKYVKKVLHIIDNKYVKLNFFEPFEEPFAYISLFQELEKLSKKYNLIIVEINSPGGYLTTLIQLYNILRKFKTIVTINCSDAYSAGFFLWILGDYRFTYSYASFMYHRESFVGYGKTSEQKRYTEHIEKIFKLFLKDIVYEFLTEKEIELAETTEIWFTGQEMIDRNICKNISEFDEKDFILSDINNVYEIDNNKVAKMINSNEYELYQKINDDKYTFNSLIDLKINSKGE